MIDQIHGNIGNITGVNDTTAQALFEVEKKGRQILVPMIDEFILLVDRKNKELHLKTPQGLIEMYL